MKTIAYGFGVFHTDDCVEPRRSRCCKKLQKIGESFVKFLSRQPAGSSYRIPVVPVHKVYLDHDPVDNKKHLRMNAQQDCWVLCGIKVPLRKSNKKNAGASE